MYTNPRGVILGIFTSETLWCQYFCTLVRKNFECWTFTLLLVPIWVWLPLPLHLTLTYCKNSMASVCNSMNLDIFVWFRKKCYNFNEYQPAFSTSYCWRLCQSVLHGFKTQYVNLSDIKHTVFKFQRADWVCILWVLCHVS